MRTLPSTCGSPTPKRLMPPFCPCPFMRSSPCPSTYESGTRSPSWSRGTGESEASRSAVTMSWITAVLDLETALLSLQSVGETHVSTTNGSLA